MRKLLNFWLRMEMNSWIKESQENLDYLYNNRKWFIENVKTQNVHKYLDYIEEKKKNISDITAITINHFSDLKSNKNIENSKMKEIINELYLSASAYRKYLKTN